MNALAKKPRKLRVERMQRLPDAGGEDSHSWAVSYADFLMVLLSFFVVFFSQDEKQRGILIDIISSGQGKAQAVAGGASAAGGAKATGGTASNPQDGPTAAELAKETYASMKVIADRMPGFDIKRDIEKQLVIMNFPDNIYGTGEFELKGQAAETLDDILIQLKTQINDFDVRFVGHTDDVQISRRKGKTLETNFDLSSLRASRALERAIKLGLPAEQLSTRGQAEFVRNSRTLSIVIVHRSGGL